MDLYFWFALRSVPHVGCVTFCRLVEHFGSPERVLSASAGELSRVQGVGGAVAASLRGHDGRLFADRELSLLERSGARVVTFLDPEYPPLLKEIADFPPYLYVKGSLANLDPAVAVVGSRRASGYGIMTTRRLAAELAREGVAIVSGMARGVDTAAHRGALENGGRTVGVLGSGVDVPYPPENGELFAVMAAQGGLVSEFPLGTLPLAENFPRRNRIISGICRGVLVVEATEKSGSLITAQCALEQGREVFAIPGNIHVSSSRGTNRLIKEGAKLVESAADIVEELPRRTGTAAGAGKACHSPLPPEDAALCSLLADGPLHIDDIMVKCALTVGELSVILLRLELAGVVAQLPGKHYALA